MPPRGQNPWFLIEEVVSKVEELCSDAQQAETDAERMKDDIIELPGGKPLLAEGTLIDRQENGADPIALRAEIRELLVGLRTNLNECLTEREAYYCLFPLTIHFDEMVQRSLDAKVQRWAPLQKELFDIDNGGELFFGAVDALLGRDETLPLIFEVFLFCLVNGFRGTLVNSSSRLNEYVAKLRSRIPKPDLSQNELKLLGRGADDSGGVELIDFPWRYYGWGLGLAISIFLSLFIFGYLDFVAQT